jgi:hypothetical protein
MDKANRQVIVAAARAAGLSQEKIAAMMATADDKAAANQEQPALLTQAQKARQLNVSRFTIRKLTRLGRLKPVELLPGLLRYRSGEFVGD